MREPMYGVAIFDQASGRFAALPLSLSPFSRRAAEPLSSLPLFAMLNEPSFFLEDGGRMQKRFPEIFWYTIRQAIPQKSSKVPLKPRGTVFRAFLFSRNR